MINKEGCHMNNGQHDETRVWLVGDYSEKAQEKEEWRRMGFRPSFVKLTDEDLSSLSKSQRQSTAREFAHDGADFFQRGYLHYGLQLWREAVRIDPEIDVVDCGYDKDIIVAMFKIFKDEQNFSNISQPIAQTASDILYQWISGLSSAHLYMTSSKYANNARCAYCGAPNSLRVWPSKGDEVPFYYCKLEKSQRRSGGYLIDVRCHKCSKVWCVVWDDDPIWALPTSEETIRFKDANHYYNAATIHRKAGRQEEALADYTSALELDATMIDAYINRGNTYRDLGRDSDAMNDYTRALEIDPDDSIVYLNIGVLLGNRGDLEAALPYFEQAARLGDAKGAAYVGQVKEMLKNRK